MGLLCVKKNPLGDSGFTRIDVGHKPDIPCFGKPFLSSHFFSSILNQKYIFAILKGFLRKVKEISDYTPACPALGL
jgi:hypothetical protein